MTTKKKTDSRSIKKCLKCGRLLSSIRQIACTVLNKNEKYKGVICNRCSYLAERMCRKKLFQHNYRRGIYVGGPEEYYT